MKIYASYQSPLGYTSGGDKNIDSYGVDHSNFTTRDEVEYQSFRQEEENRRIKGYQKYGLTEGYPQFGTNFWGNPANNYGFGSSNIHENIENLRDEQTGFTSPFGQGSWGTSQNDLGSGSASYNTGNCTMSYAPDGYFTNRATHSSNRPVTFKKEGMLDILGEGLKGFGMGVEAGLLRGVNGLSLGALNFLSKKYLGDIYAQKQKEVADQVYGYNSPITNNLYDISNWVIDEATENMPKIDILRRVGKGLGIRKIF